MAAIIQGLTNTFIAKSLAGDIDFDTDTFKMALYTNDATLDASTSAYTTTNEVVGTGYVADGPYVYSLDRSTGEPWSWSDSFGNDASFGFKGEVRSSAKLPDRMPNALVDTVVEVTGGTAESEDNYLLKYTGTTWVETR